MLKYVGWFGVRRRINEIVDRLNEEDREEGSFESVSALFGQVFMSLVKIRNRLRVLERKESIRRFFDDTRQRIDSEMLVYSLEKIEELEERLAKLEGVSPEDDVSLRSENDETSVQDSETEDG